MLTTLRIKNLALVDDLTLDLRPGYTAITGETGAGKSIVIGALSLVLGERAERTLIRAGCESCTVEAAFEIAVIRPSLGLVLEENGIEPCEAGQLVIKRTFTAAGANRQFVNGTPTTLLVLARLGEWLVDIHGPHDHQSLLHSARQLDILDAFAGLEADRAAFQGLFRKKGALLAERAALVVDEQTYAQQLDLLRFQIHEITEARFQPEEEAELDSAHRRASNAVRLVELAQAALHVLSQADESALAQLGRAGRTLQELQRIDPTTAPLTELHAQAAQLVDDLRAATSRYLDGIETNPADLQVLEDRLNLLQRLKRKYGPSVRDIIEFAAEAQRKLTSLEQRDAELTRLRKELAQLDEDLRQAGAKLSARRQKAIPGLVKAVERELGVLGFRQSRFQVQFEGLPAEKKGAIPASPALSSSGFDKVEFLFAPNPGEPPRPLRAIASSGEMARVMLALKTALADQDEIPVLVFDEVDANVGGETASSVGERMRRIGRRHQVLCVTHLAPVAARADTHLVVSKEVRAGRTLSQVGELGASARAQELARMLGGPTDAALRHAKALLQAVE